MGIKGKTVKGLSMWRNVALAAWRAPDDPTIYGQMDIDCTKLLAALRKAEQKYGRKLTVTHAVIRAVGLGLQKHPDCNTMIRRGKLFQRDVADVYCLVAVAPRDGEAAVKADLSGKKICDVPSKSVADIAAELETGSAKIRDGKDPLGEVKKLFEKIPTGILHRVINGASSLMFDLDLDLESIGIPADPFGGAVVTSVGMFGLDRGQAPLTPFMRVGSVMMVGAVTDRVVAVDGQPAVRPLMTLCGTLDHRLIDGYHAGKLARTLRGLLENPAPELIDV